MTLNCMVDISYRTFESSLSSFLDAFSWTLTWMFLPWTFFPSGHYYHGRFFHSWTFFSVDVFIKWR